MHQKFISNKRKGNIIDGLLKVRKNKATEQRDTSRTPERFMPTMSILSEEII